MAFFYSCDCCWRIILYLCFKSRKSFCCSADIGIDNRSTHYMWRFVFQRKIKSEGMDMRFRFGHRHRIGFIVLALLSGFLLGLGAFFLKISMSYLSLSSMLSILLVPELWVSGILLITGFYFLQMALHSGFISIVMPVSIGTSIIIPAVLAFLFLNESISILKWAGIIFILFGVFGFASKTRK